MSVKDDGGSAYPVQAWEGPNDQAIWPERGMSLRDYFAGQVVSGAMSSSWGENALNKLNESKPGSAHTLSQFAYSVADCMLAARTTGEKE